jgi:hypothetical protein
MNRALTITAMAGAIFVSGQAFPVDSTGQPAMGRRQMAVQIVGCMKKRMAADKLISYNEAAKACKGQISKRSANSPPGTLVASDTPATP